MYLPDSLSECKYRITSLQELLASPSIERETDRQTDNGQMIDIGIDSFLSVCLSPSFRPSICLFVFLYYTFLLFYRTSKGKNVESR